MLKGKTAVITGSTSGIGLGIARALAAEGCDIMLNGFGDADAIEKTRKGMEADAGVSVRYSGADLTKAEEVEGLISQAVSELGGVDILVNNAGAQHVYPIEEFPPEKWDLIIALNLTAAFHAIRHALPHMRKAGWGRIINTASVQGLVGSVHKSAYVASKHGVVGLTKVVGLETAGSGITCNAFCPGWVRTPLLDEQITARAAELGGSEEDGALDILREKQPSLQFVTVEQAAGLIVFLCSESAAQITGTAIPMDGGWTAQ